MLRMMESAAKIGLQVSVGVPLTKENVAQVDELLQILGAHGGEDVHLLIPHGEGRGVKLESIRLSLEDLSKISEHARSKLNRKVYQTEAEWCKIKGGEPEQNRLLLISLTDENMDRLERMPISEIIREVEALDEAYYGAFPSFATLLDQYGDAGGQRLYSRRDLFHRCRRQYAKEHDIHIYDVTDERQSGSRRY